MASTLNTRDSGRSSISKADLCPLAGSGTAQASQITDGTLIVCPCLPITLPTSEGGSVQQVLPTVVPLRSVLAQTRIFSGASINELGHHEFEETLSSRKILRSVSGVPGQGTKPIRPQPWQACHQPTSRSGAPS